ncbi:hypothetical protein INR49_021435 [Caranx melampygus]|nr:hypothetical protein INR49_021435 [Caranx melampygus]
MRPFSPLSPNQYKHTSDDCWSLLLLPPLLLPRILPSHHFWTEEFLILTLKGGSRPLEKKKHKKKKEIKLSDNQKSHLATPQSLCRPQSQYVSPAASQGKPHSLTKGKSET